MDREDETSVDSVEETSADSVDETALETTELEVELAMVEEELVTRVPRVTVRLSTYTLT